MDVLRCQTFVGVMKELAVFVAVYNLVRRVLRQAAQRQGVKVDRVSFTDAVAGCGRRGRGRNYRG